MNRLLWILIIILLEGCATSYEKCSRNMEFQRYGGMDECVAIKEEERRAARQAWRDAWNQPQPQVIPIQYYQPPKQSNCVSSVIGNQVYTNCY